MPRQLFFIPALTACLIVACLFPGAHYAQEKRYVNGLYFERFSQSEGLPSQGLDCMASSRPGYLWLGSSFGIVRYDGYSFRPYLYSGSSLPFNYGVISLLSEDENGNLWFTINGREEIFLFNPATETYRHFTIRQDKGQPFPGRPTALVAAAGNELWIGDAQTGLYHARLLNKGGQNKPELKVRHFPSTAGTEGGPLSNTIQALLLHPGGDLWIATDKGISRVKAGQHPSDSLRFIHFQPGEEEPANLESAAALALSPSGGIWAAGRKTGPPGSIVNAISYFDYSPGKFLPLPVPLSGKAPVSSMLESSDGRLYIGTRGEGLYILPHARNALKGEPATARNYKFEPPAAWEDATITDILQDPFENIWIATALTGLYKLNPYFNQFSHYRIPPSPGDDDVYITLATEGPEGDIWLGSSSAGVYRFNRRENTFTQYLPEEGNPYSLASRTALYLFIDRDSNLWIGTAGGPNRFDPETGRFIRYPEPKGYIVHIYEDEEGYFWVGTIGGGLTILDPSRAVVARYRRRNGHPGSLNSNEVWQTYKDSRGEIYLMTSNGLHRVIRNGPLRRDSLLFERIDGPSPLAAWMHESPKGHYWLSYLGYIFCHWDPDDYTCREYPLPSDMANVILEDGRGRLWLSAGEGIYRFDPETQTMDSYDGSYGIPFAGLGRFGRRNGSGEITLSAGPIGFTIFHPDSIRANPTAPIVKIISIFTTGRSGKDSLAAPPSQSLEEMRVPYRRNSLTIEYQGLHFSYPEKIRYTYRMQGLEEGWVEAGQSRVARYSKLPPGRYIFQVKAASPDGIWSKILSSAPICIAPPWWRTWWAYGAYGTLFLAALYFANHYQQRQWELQAQLQLEKQRAAQLQEVDELKNHFITNITHEFRTPLTIILGMAGQIGAQPQALLKEGVKMITRNARTLLRLVNQMLDLARVEAGKLELNMRQADIIPFLHYLLESFHSLAGYKNITLHFQSSQPSLTMDYDPERLSHILSNLLSNAIKFTPEGGKVQIQVKSRNVAPGYSQEETAPANSFLLITVRDNGIGIPEEKLPYLFNRFYQAHPGPGTTSSPQGGTGIGLALARELAQLMGGGITVESEPGKGSAFTVELPITREAAVEAGSIIESSITEPAEEIKSGLSLEAETGKTAETIPTKGQSPLLLIVEDNPDVTRYLQTLLKGQYRIMTAIDGEDGTTRAIEHIPDIIISDIMMPKRDGMELCSLLKEDRRTSHIPIILLTARADLRSRLQGLDRGADAYLAKPFNPRELEIQMRKALRLRQTLREK
ncbi:MAG: response regulator, partial [Phaeodactylibacter sp.]|nr:response regulator [Phaeodactylibacter sp.]